MAISFGTNGRPFAVCPNCNRLHPIMRRADHVDKPAVRCKCSHCKTSWQLSEGEREQVKSYHAQHQGRKKGRPPKASTGTQKPSEPQGQNSPPATNPPTEKPRKRGLLDFLA